MKIVKFFVVFNLILSISLINSVAAISVSDGSAFVTKAEFAADLNNLSNRMSTLENSLDAKIDSLVSSYLSRNGIWNGEKQEILSFKEEAIWSNRWATKTTGDEKVENSFTNVCKVNKSGLGNLKMSVKGNNGYGGNTTTFATIFRINSIMTMESDTAKGIVTFSYDIADVKGTNINIVFQKNIYTQIFNTTNHRRFFIGYLPSFTFDDFFFVEKDMELNLRLVVVSEGSNFANNWLTKDISNTPYVNPKLKISSFIVYQIDILMYF